MIAGLGAINPIALGGTSAAAATTPPTATAASGSSFGSVLAQGLNNGIGNMRQAEQMAVDALQGKADMREVVDTVMSAEQSLQAAVAIRDKIVSAYLEVSRMAI